MRNATVAVRVWVQAQRQFKFVTLKGERLVPLGCLPCLSKVARVCDVELASFSRETVRETHDSTLLASRSPMGDWQKPRSQGGSTEMARMCFSTALGRR